MFATLAPVLPAGATIDQARQVHAQIADAAKIRVGRELTGGKPTQAADTVHLGPAYPGSDALETIAIRRELARLRAATPGYEDMSHGRERQLGQRELAMGQREIAMLEREVELSNRLDALARQEERLATQQRDLEQREQDLAGSAEAVAKQAHDLNGCDGEPVTPPQTLLQRWLRK